MNYERDQFLRLIEAVEDQGGTHLDETCSMTTYVEWTGDKDFKGSTYHYAGCGSNSLFEVPIGGREDAIGVPMGEKGDAKLPKTGLPYLNLPESKGTVKVCAIEDGVGLWPRFIDQVME